MGFPATFGAFAFLSILSTTCSKIIPVSCNSTTLYPSLNSTQILTTRGVFNFYKFMILPPNTTCRWLITAPYGYKVQIKFILFDTRGTSGSCTTSTSDYLEVYDSSDDSSTKRLNERYCGTKSLPPTLVSSGRHMYLKYSIGVLDREGYPGFKLEYTAVNNKLYGCISSSLTADSNTTKILTTPNYPNYYPLSTACQWKITAPSGYVVQIKFTNFSTFGYSGSCSFSHHSHKLYIYDSSYIQSSKLLGLYCGKYLPANVVSSGRDMFIIFESFALFIERTGFRFEYRAVKDLPEDHSMCSPFNSAFTNNNIKLKASSSYKYIKSPYYPNKYPSGIQCTWIISASSILKIIKLTLTDVNIHNEYSYRCRSTTDSLTIRDGSSSSSTQLKQFCSKSSSSTTVTSKGQKLWIQFKTNSDNYFRSDSRAGFQVKFIEVSNRKTVGMIVGIVLGIIGFIGFVVCCVCVITKRRGQAGYRQANTAASTVVQTTTTT